MLEPDASGWIRSIGTDLNISQQERAQRLQGHSSNSAGASRGSWKPLHTERDKSQLEMAELCDLWEMAASQSKMTGNGQVTKSPGKWAFWASHK